LERLLKININSRSSDAENFEACIINAMQSIGLKFDGSDFDFDGNLNRGIYFFVNNDINFELIEINSDIEDEGEV